MVIQKKPLFTLLLMIAVILISFGIIIGLFIYYEQQTQRLQDKKVEALELVNAWNRIVDTTKDLMITDDLPETRKRWTQAISTFDRGLNAFIRSAITRSIGQADRQFNSKIKETENMWRIIKPRIEYVQPRLEEYLLQQEQQGIEVKRSLLHELLYQIGRSSPGQNYMVLFDLTYDIEYMVSSLSKNFDSGLAGMVSMISSTIDRKTFQTQMITLALSVFIVASMILFIVISQNALGKSQERFRRIVELAPFPVAIIHSDGQGDYINSKFTEVFGYTLEEISTADEWVKRAFPDPAYRSEVVKAWSAEQVNAEHPKTISQLLNVTCKDGMIRKVIFVKVYIDDKTQFLICEDMTDRLRAEEALRASELKFRMLFDSASDAILILDEGRIIDCNQKMPEMFGRTREEIIGATPQSLSPVNQEDGVVSEEKAQERLKAALAGQQQCFEWKQTRGDGTLFDTEVSINCVEIQGKPHLQAIARDITGRKRAEEERKNLEEKLTRSEKMEALGRLAGGVAHDLNNILSGIVSYPDFMLTTLPEDSPLRKDINIIKQSGERAAAIVQDLLTLSRRGVSDKEVSNLNEVITNYLHSPEHEKLRAHYPAATVSFAPEHTLRNVVCSEYNLFKVIMNLVSNSLEAMPDGGVIRIATRSEYIDRPVCGYDRVEEGDYIVLTVTDEGMGIAPEDLQRIFEPFYTKKVMGRRSGTGLGMSVVWGIVHDHKGYINVNSTVGKGTTLDIYFPVTLQDMTGPMEELDREKYRGKGELILVVDDVQVQREIAKAILTSLGYTVETANSGEQAIEYLGTHTVDLVVLDMIMDPGIDGLETYKRIIEMHPRQKAVIVSGYTESGRAEEAQRLGAGHYVRKPYSIEKLGLAVRGEINKQDS